METVTGILFILATLIIGIAIGECSCKKVKFPKVTFLVDKEGNFKGYKLNVTIDNPNLKTLKEQSNGKTN